MKLLLAFMLSGLAFAASKRRLGAPLCNEYEGNDTFEDFLAAQGADSTFFRPSPDILGTINKDFDNLIFFLMDYAGIWNKFYGYPWDTEVTGEVKISCVDDGVESVVVDMTAKNAVAWAAYVIDEICAPKKCCFDCTERKTRKFNFLAGDDAARVAAGLSEGAFGNVHAKFQFQRPAGAPFEDLVVIAGNRGDIPEGYKMEGANIVASFQDSKTKVWSTQVGSQLNPNCGKENSTNSMTDCWPIEQIHVHEF